MSGIEILKNHETAYCQDIVVHCPKCGDITARVSATYPGKLKALVQFRLLILRVHDRVEHEGN